MPEEAVPESSATQPSADRALAGRRVLITGGGSGIGAAVAREAVRLGARVALLDRDGDAASRTAASLGDSRALAFEGDVTDEATADAALAGMRSAWGGIDDLVNNAGIWDNRPLLTLDLEAWRRVLEVNLLAPVAFSKAAVQCMPGGGSIVNVSSVLGQVGAPDRGPYCVSKAALIALTKVQAVEWASRGVRVNAIAPGYIMTEGTRSFVASGGVDAAAVCRRTPLGRFGGEDEVAAGICFLLDPVRAAYVTGHVLEVNGGWTAYGFL
jgi:NAD(P)-dependent dehydrogenase (short-subunit alcohol dehydrogenase family)